MAAATVASVKYRRIGRRRIVHGRLTAPANTNTWDTGLRSIDHVNIGFPGGDLAAADAVSYAASGGTLTFTVIGTGRDLSVEVTGT